MCRLDGEAGWLRNQASAAYGSVHPLGALAGILLPTPRNPLIGGHSYIRTYGTGPGPVGASVGLPFQPSSSAAGQDIKAKCSTGIEKLATVCELVDKDNETRRLLGADDILTSARKSIKEGDAALDQSAAQTAQDLVASAGAVARVSPAGMEHGGANGHIAPALRTTADGGPRQTVF